MAGKRGGVKFTEHAKRALGEADTKTVTFEMTPELKEKYQAICHKIVDLLMAETRGPVEAYMVIQFVQLALEEMAGIKGGIIIENQDSQH